MAKNLIETCDIKDLNAYYNVCCAVLDYYDNVYRSYEGVYDTITTNTLKKEAEEKVKLFNEKRDIIRAEMEKRILGL